MTAFHRLACYLLGHRWITEVEVPIAQVVSQESMSAWVHSLRTRTVCERCHQPLNEFAPVVCPTQSTP